MRISIDRNSASPAYRQIADRIREAIASGSLLPGDRIPSARSLASQLGSARGTVDTAYALLAGEGYIQARGPAGSVISPSLTGATPAPARRRRPPVDEAPPPWLAVRPFRLGLPALDAFPRGLWSRLTGQAARRLDVSALAYPNPGGLPELREAIAGYLGVARGVACTPRQVLVTAGFQGALSLIAHAMIRESDAVWTEDPGYFLARELLERAGARPVPVPVDAEGLQVAEGMRRAPAARFAVVTPTHQSPLGVALSLSRRVALLGWASDTQGWIIEDDYDSEFRYTGRPLPALKSLDRSDRVLYAGSFSKVLFPGLRLGYLVAPESLVGRLEAAARTLQAGVPALEQRVTASFMTQGHFARHLRRMRLLYAARRQALVRELARSFGSGLSLELQAGGMHLLARFPGLPSDTELVRRAEAAGLSPTALSSLSPTGRAGDGLLLGFTNVPEADAAAQIARLARALQG